MVIKFLYQLLQRENLTVVHRRPAQQRHIVDNRLGNKALLDQILVRGMAAPLAQLLMLFVRNQRTVHINRNFPAKRFVETVILR